MRVSMRRCSERGFPGCGHVRNGRSFEITATSTLTSPLEAMRADAKRCLKTVTPGARGVIG
jgi:hypothetical protein